MSDAAPTATDDGTLLRGGTLLLSAKAVAVLGGFALYWLLARIFTASLGETEGTAAFGVWGATFGVINPFNGVAAAGTLQMMSRLVSSRGGPASLGGGVFGRAALTQLLWMLTVLVAFEAGAGVIARYALNDPSYAPVLRLAALIPLFYALRALCEGYLNGTRRFGDQALLDVGATVLRLGFVIAGAWTGHGAMGAVGGFVVASMCMAAVAVAWVRPPREPDADLPSVFELFAFQARVIGVTLVTQYLLQVDLLAVKALASPDPAVADQLTGTYTAAQKLAQVPLALVLALGTLMFSYVASEHERSAAIVRSGMRVLLLVMVPAAAVLMPNAAETLALVFPTLGADAAMQAQGATSLAWLAVAYVPCAMFLTGTTLVTATGRPGRSAGVAALTLALAALGARWLLPGLGLPGAAIAVGSACCIGLVACVALLGPRYRRLVEPASALRMLGAGALVALLARAIPSHGAWLLLEDLGLVLLFGVLLLGLRELRIAEIRRLLRGGRR
jgi:O-antigen/teichoic acid export membrane protein